MLELLKNSIGQELSISQRVTFPVYRTDPQGSSAQPWIPPLCGMRCHSNTSSLVSSQNTCPPKSQTLRPHCHDCHNCTSGGLAQKVVMRSSDSFFPMAFLHWDVLLLKCTWWELTWFPHSWTMVTLILTLSSRMNYAELLSTLAPNIHADSLSLTPVYIGLDIDLKDATSIVVLNLGTQYTCVGRVLAVLVLSLRNKPQSIDNKEIIFNKPTSSTTIYIACSNWFRYEVVSFLAEASVTHNKYSDEGHGTNIAKGTTDPRVEFWLPK